MATLSSQDQPLLAGDRFVLEKRLGSGGMGVVYAVVDRRLGARLALKTLKRASAEALLLFKREFRFLADLSHPNLVALHELLFLDGQWAFTMEMIEGSNFLRYIRPPEVGLPFRDLMEEATVMSGHGVTHSVSGTSSETTPPSSSTDEEPDDPRPGPLDLDRLRSTLPQLAQGMIALHRSGLVHRDLKPSNVLVSHRGRLVICDFGLVAPVGVSDDIRGTPAYMSPEQASGRALDTASDWYAVGVMLYQSLTGRPPFSGETTDLFVRKQNLDPPAPSECEADVPKDLDALCCDLLARDPARRPTGEEVLARLGLAPAPIEISSGPAPFVGRAEQLAHLDRALAAVRGGDCNVVLVHGSSGLGKTALVQQFVDRVSTEGTTRILASRCYQQESVPYKAADGLLDALTADLSLLQPSVLDGLVRDEALPLVRLFPVLKQLRSFSSDDRRAPASHQEQQREAFTAFRALLSSLARSRTLLLFVDDIQWADLESTALFTELLRAPDAPPLLLIAACRTDDLPHSPLAQSLMKSAQVIALGPLSSEESATFTRLRLTGDGDAALAQAATSEAEGNPYLLDELLRAPREAWALSGSNTRQRLDAVVKIKLDALPPPARALLNAVALAGSPLPRVVAGRAAALAPEEEAGALSVLRAQRLIRTVRGGGEVERLETYHDRVRETACDALLSEDRRALHVRLAGALDASGHATPELLFEHWQAAGETVRAAPYAVEAGHRSQTALAFDRAAHFFRWALAHGGAEGPEALKLWLALGGALANAGRGVEASEAYLTAANQTDGERAVDLRGQAAEQLLLAGHFERGQILSREAVRALGIYVPRGLPGSVVAYLWNRLRLRWRGLVPNPRPQRDAARLKKINALWTQERALAFVDPLRGGVYEALRARLAMDCDDPFQVAAAFLSEAVIAASTHGDFPRAWKLLDETDRMTEGNLEPLLIAQRIGGRGLTHYLTGQWPSAVKMLEKAMEYNRRYCTGGAWEFSNANFFILLGLFMQGEVIELERRFQASVGEAAERGDVYTEANLRTAIGAWTALAHDDVPRAQQEVELAGKLWKQSGFHLQHYFRGYAEAHVLFYAGQVEQTQKLLSDLWPRVVRTLLDRPLVIRMTFWHLQGAVALAALDKGVGSRSWALRTVERAARELERIPMPHAQGIARLIHAGIAWRRKELSAAGDAFGRAVEMLEQNGSLLYAQVGRRQWAVLRGEETALAKADGWMTEHGVRDPPRFAGLFAPLP